MSDGSVPAAATCRVGVGGRLTRAAVAVFAAAFAASILPADPLMGVIAAVVAVAAAIMTITGRCPMDPVEPTERAIPANPLAFADGREQAGLSTPALTPNRSSHARQ